MKKVFRMALLFVACAFVAAMAACSDDDKKNDVIVSYDDLPAAAKTFVTTYYANTQVSRVERDNDKGIIEYEVYFANRHDVTFNSAGEWIEVDAPDNEAIPAGIAPQPIVDYLNVNYADDAINDITRLQNGYEVDLIYGPDLLFDAQGQFVRIER